MSLVSPLLVASLGIVGTALVLAAVDWRAPHRARRLALVVAVAAVITGLVTAGHVWWGWVPYSLPGRDLALLLLPGAAVGALVVSLRTPAGRWRRAGRAAVGVLAVPVALALVAAVVNAQYGYYPTVASLSGTPRHHVSLAQLQTPTPRPTDAHGRPRPTTGELVQVSVPPTASHFAARAGWVWVPPSYVDGSDRRLPVVMLLAGTPGQPDDWWRAAHADQTADAYAAAHDGVAPILVMPDVNGSLTGDTECVDSPRGQAETYLTVDVPAYVRATFGVGEDQRWGVAGFSEGGECAAMLALRHPALFAAFGDYSGLAAPTVGNSVDAPATTRVLFDGETREYDEHDPAWLLAHGPARVAGLLAAGGQDHETLDAQRELVGLAAADHLGWCSVVRPGGGHNFRFWTTAFATSLPWLDAELSGGQPTCPDVVRA